MDDAEKFGVNEIRGALEVLKGSFIIRNEDKTKLIEEARENKRIAQELHGKFLVDSYIEVQQ